jgi:hypothetical protein
MLTLHPHDPGLRSIVAKYCLVVCLLALTAAGAEGATWPNVTVNTLDGWEYPGMTVEARADEPAIMLINAQGGRKNMPRASIRNIVDATGRDVTEWVFAGEEPDRAAPAGEENAPRREPEAGPPITPTPEAVDSERTATTTGRHHGWGTGSALPARVLVLPSLTIGASGSGGDAFTGLQSGGSLGFGLRISAVKNVYIGFDYRRQWLDVERFAAIVRDASPPYPYYDTYQPGVHLDELYFVVGVHPHTVRLEKPITFVEAGVGSVFESNDGGVSWAAGYGGGGFRGFFDDTNFGVLFAGGVILPLSPGVPGVGLSLGANIRLTGADLNVGNKAGMLFGLTAGFTFLLGDSH